MCDPDLAVRGRRKKGGVQGVQYRTLVVWQRRKKKKGCCGKGEGEAISIL